MGQISLYQLLLIFALGGFVYLVYLRGNRKNRYLHSIISSELEAGINPIEKLYKNLGGTIGYKALYTRKGYINKVVAVFTTLPRHSIIVYPFHLIFGGHDKLQINIYSEKKILPNFVCIRNKKRYLKLLSKYNIDGLKNKEIKSNDNTYIVYYSNSFSLDICKKMTDDSFSDTLISISASPSNNSFYLYCIPKKGKIEPLIKNYISTIKNYLVK